MTRGIRVVVLSAALVATLVIGATPASAAKRVPPCTLITVEQLEPVFEQPFGRGRLEIGDTCAFARPADASIDPIIVHLRALEYPTAKKAKLAYEREADIVIELSAAGVTPVQQIGDEAFYAFFVGTDQMTIRVGKFIAEISVEQTDEPDRTFAEEVVGVGAGVAANLLLRT